MKIKKLAFPIVIGILSVVFVVSLLVCVAAFWSELSYARGYVTEPDSFYYSLQDSDYSRVLDGMYRNKAAGVEETAEYREIYAVALYFEAASYYKAYGEAGDIVSAEREKAVMEAQIPLMGELSYAVEDIHRQLGIVSFEDT